MKKAVDILLLLLLLFLSVPWSTGDEETGEAIKCSEQVLKERENRRMANITITVCASMLQKFFFFLYLAK